MVAIHPETLKTFRKRSSLSQDALAKASKVGVATIKRIEAAEEAYEARFFVAERLAHALGVAVETLSGEPRDGGERKRMLQFLGYRPIKVAVRAENALSYDMVEHLYGVPMDRQIAIAPLLVALMAEGSLAWRREKLAAIDEATKKLRLIGDDAGHLCFVNSVWQTEDGAQWERESIEKKDLFGRNIPDESYEFLDYDPYMNNPFVDYLRAFAKRIESDLKIFMERTGEVSTCDIQIGQNMDRFNNELPNYLIGASVVEKITGNEGLAESSDFGFSGSFGFFYASDNTRLTLYAMARGHAKIKDIPEDLIGEDRKDERIEWIISRIPGEERKLLEEKERELEAFVKELKIDLSETAGDAPSPESC